MMHHSLTVLLALTVMLAGQLEAEDSLPTPGASSPSAQDGLAEIIEVPADERAATPLPPPPKGPVTTGESGPKPQTAQRSDKPKAFETIHTPSTATNNARSDKSNAQSPVNNSPKGNGKDSEDELKAEIVQLPPLKPTPSTTTLKPVKDSATAPLKESGLPKLPAATTSSKEPGFATVLKGRIEKDCELGPQNGPILIRGNLVIPAGVTLTFKAGTAVTLDADPKGEKAAQPGSPDSTQCGVIWVWGSLITEGVTGNPVEIVSRSKEQSALLLYGKAQSSLEGLRLKHVAVAQSGGTALWSNCELFEARHYALASGVAILTHCTLVGCGGVFATYDAGAWSLMMRMNVFENCREGVILGSDPGEARLVIEKNNFLGTRGAHLRVMPIAALTSKLERGDRELLIGENWYGSAVPEEIDLRIVDRRMDPTLKARLNTRPPAAQPYKDLGAGVTPALLSATLKHQQPLQQKLLRAHNGLAEVPAAGKQDLAITKPLK